MKVKEIPINKIRTLENVRARIKEKDIADLMCSIKQQGLIHPITVYPSKNNKDFIIIQGNRRLSSCRKLGWTKIPADVKKTLDTEEMILYNLTENLQRKDVSVIEEGRLLYRLHKEMNLSKSEIAARLSLNAGRVNTSLRAFQYTPEEFRNLVIYGQPGVGLTRKLGKIPAMVNNEILNLRRLAQLSAPQLKEIYNYVKKNETTGKDIEVLMGLIKGGLTFEKALNELHNYKVYRLDIPLRHSEVEALKKKHNLSTLELFRNILYGKIKFKFTVVE